MSKASPNTPPQSLSNATPDAAPIKGSQLIFYSVALTLIVVWGTAFTMIGYSVKYITPEWIVMSRLILAAVIVVIYMHARGHRFPPLRDKRWLWYTALAFTGMAAPFWLIAWGQKTIDSGLSAVIVGAMPLMTIILAHFFAGERLTLFKGLGFFMGFIGIAVLFLPSDLNLNLIADWKAQGCMVIAAFLYALTTVMAKRAPETPPSMGAAMMMICAALMGLIMALPASIAAGGGELSQIPAVAWLCVIGLGIGSTALGTILYLYMINVYGPSALAKVNYLPPLVSVFAGLLFLGETFTMKLLVALVLIFAGLLVSGVKRRIPVATRHRL